MNAESFVDLIKTINGSNTNQNILCLHMFKTIIESYAEPHRFYHTWTHIVHGLNEMIEEINADNINLLRLAYMYHDIVYIPCYEYNEEASAAKLWVDGHHLGIDTKTLYVLRDLILVTDHKSPAKFRDHRLIADVDLTIFGQDYDTIKEYNNDIRKEYFWLPDMTYLLARIKILSRFVKKDNIFYTQYFRTKYEEIARNNLHRLIGSLQSDLLAVPRC